MKDLKFAFFRLCVRWSLVLGLTIGLNIPQTAVGVEGRVGSDTGQSLWGPLAPSFPTAPPPTVVVPGENGYSPIQNAITLKDLIRRIEAIPPTGTCFEDVRGKTDLNCTANDISIAGVNSFQVLDDGCLGDGDLITVILTFTIQSNATDKYDVGFAVAADGGDAKTGSCYTDYLHPLGTPISTTSGVGPFRNTDGDTCGDVSTADGTYLYRTQPMQLTCRDANNDGFLDVSTIIGWGQAANTVNTCSGFTDIAQNIGSSKCNIDNAVQIPILVPAGNLALTKTSNTPVVSAGNQISYTIILTSNPPNATANATSFDTRITDTLPTGFTWTLSPSVSGCAINAGVLTCDFGNIASNSTPNTRTVTIIADTSIQNCGTSSNTVDGTFRETATGAVLTRTSTASTQIMCAKIGVDKVTLPSADPTLFSFPVTQGAAEIMTLVNTDGGGIKYTGWLTPGLIFAITEAVPSGWQLDSATCDNGQTPGSITATGGITVTCTFNDSLIPTPTPTRTPTQTPTETPTQTPTQT
ncbi:MAG TPA: hypothetical protein PLW39_07305, partial [Thermoflexales bacterium]|nr:hypothetical protein [Thermoflexales bacterium]